MRLSIISIDGTVCIDGVCYIGLDLSWIPVDVHAVQWYGTYGEVEFIDNSPNMKIDSLGIYEQAIDSFDSETKRLEYEHSSILASLDYTEILREERNRLLTLCDWTQLPDVKISEENLIEWKVYRQKLRDLPKTTLNPKNPEWPQPPN